MKIFKEIRFYLVMVTLMLLGLLINYLDVKDELTKCKADKGFISGGDIQKAEMQETIDSLQNELFNVQVINGRYEITFDHLKEINPKIGNELEEWMSHNTE
jgi:hypothetical protein